MPQNPRRISDATWALRQAMEAWPQQRMGQVIENAIGTMNTFYLNDEGMLQMLHAYAEKGRSVNKLQSAAGDTPGVEALLRIEAQLERLNDGIEGKKAKPQDGPNFDKAKEELKNAFRAHDEFLKENPMPPEITDLLRDLGERLAKAVRPK